MASASRQVVDFTSTVLEPPSEEPRMGFRVRRRRRRGRKKKRKRATSELYVLVIASLMSMDAAVTRKGDGEAMARNIQRVYCLNLSVYPAAPFTSSVLNTETDTHTHKVFKLIQ